MTGAPDDTRAGVASALRDEGNVHFELTLIINGASDLSARAIANARALCDEHLPGRSNLSVVDLNEQPSKEGIVAAPTLVRTHPLPVRRIVGDLSQTDKVLLALDLPRPRPRSEIP